MRIVRNGDQYAVVKGRWIFTKYLDLSCPCLWHTKLSIYYEQCWGSLNGVKQALKQLPPKTYEVFEELE